MQSGPNVFSEQGPPQALSLHVGYGYLPSYGTLMVDATINAPDPTINGKPLQCAIHYVDADGEVRYCVQPVSEGGAQPIEPLGGMRRHLQQ